MEYSKILDYMAVYGSNKEDIIKRRGYEEILECVVIAPWWEHTIFDDFSTSIKQVGDKVYNVFTEACSFSFIEIKGIGASALIEEVLALGVTKCKKIIFIGSAGAIDESINIGDLVIPKLSINGVGVTRYLNENLCDDFEEKYYSSEKLNAKLVSVIEALGHNVKIVENYSVDTIIAQFPHIEHIINLNAKTIEMETSALFKCANIMGIDACALFVISDNSVKNKSLYSGRSEEDSKRRKMVRKGVVPVIINEFFKDNKGDN